MGHVSFREGTKTKKRCVMCFPRDPITLSDDDWGIQSPPQQGI